MSTGYSAHPVLASELLQNAASANHTTTTNATTTRSQKHCSQHRRQQNSAEIKASTCDIEAKSTSRGFFSFSPFKSKSISKVAELVPPVNLVEDMKTPTPMRATTSQKTLPDRTDEVDVDVDVDVGCFSNIVDDDPNYDGEPEDNTIEHTKDCVDCVDCAPPQLSARCIDEPDNLQHRFNRSRSQQQREHTSFYSSNGGDGADSRPKLPAQLPAFSDACLSGLSSAISSPSPSTVSSPFSTPTRLTTQLQHSHQNCCRKSTLTPGANSTHQHQHQHHHHHHLYHHRHQHHHNHGAHAAVATSSASSSPIGGCKKLQKFDPRFGPSPYRQLLPIILCILSFATVFTILIIYMDTTEIRHQQFRLNMSRDYDLFGVAQDNPTLVAFLREIHMRKYPMHFLKNHGDATAAAATSVGSLASATVSAATGTFNFSTHHDGLVPEMANYVAELVGGKMNGAVIQSLTGTLGQLITAPWLAETLNWAGIIVEPEPRRYFTLHKQNLQRPHMQVVHACVSPNSYPKEVTIHNEESEVRINSLLDEETSWFNSRVKCFPLYTIMLACNRVEFDLLSLGVHGHELEILQTLPFDKIKIDVISIHLLENFDKTPRGYIQKITKFLTGKGYKLQKSFSSNYFYQRINSTNRTRKKDILLLKTP